MSEKKMKKVIIPGHDIDQEEFPDDSSLNKYRRCMYFTAHLAFQGQQVGGTNSIQSQLDLCKAYCTENSYTLSEDQMYYELKEGTVETDHPELGHPRKAVPPGFIDVLVVASLGRLTREDRANVILIEQLKPIGLATEATEKHRAKKNKSANALSS